MPKPNIRYEPRDIVPQELWDLGKIRTLPLNVRVRSECVKESPDGAMLLREIYYTSDYWQGEAIRIAAHVALPLHCGPRPAMVFGTGSPGSAENFAREHRVACIAIDRPGTGDSNGPPDEYMTWIALENDPRDGWMFHFVTAVLRAITYMQQQPEVDGSRIGVTGSSRGGTMSLIANGVDDRITLCVAQATAGDILTAFDHGGWANYLYTDDDGNPGIPTTFRIFALYGDPIHYAKTQHGAAYLILGAQDEYFPIYTAKTTCDAMEGDFRIELIPDWDHGLFRRDDPKLGVYDNSKEAGRRTSACMRHAVRCHLLGERAMPLPPTHSWIVREGGLDFTAAVDLSWPVKQVDLIHSADEAYLFQRTPMARFEDSFRDKFRAPLDLATEEASRLAAYVEVEYEDGPFMTSVPEFGMEFSQRMRERPEAAPTEFVKEEIEYASSIDDIAPINAAVAYNKLRKNAPILVVLAGGVPGTRQPADEEIERLSRKGLFVIAPSLRGRDGSGGKCDCMGREVYDLFDAVEHVRRHYADLVDPDVVSLLSYSAGGAVGLLAGARFPDTFRAVISYFGITDRADQPYWELLERSPEGEDEERAYRIAKMVVKYVGGSPSQAPDAYAARRTLDAVGNLAQTRVVLFHDREDWLVPAAQSERFAERAGELGLSNVALHLSWPDDGRRWLHGHPNRVPQLRAGEDKFMGVVTQPKAWPTPRLPSEGRLMVLGYLRARAFEVWLGDGLSAAAELEYVVSEDEIRLRLRQTAGSGGIECRALLSAQAGCGWQAERNGSAADVACVGDRPYVLCGPNDSLVFRRA